MSQTELSIAMTAFRREKWLKFYESILWSTKREFELIIVSPHHELPEELKQYNNIIHVQDKGSPMRCAQRAASLATGKVLNVLPADDGVYLPGAIDQGIDMLYSLGGKLKDVVSVQYLEGPKGQKIRQPREYYQLNYHAATRLKCIPDQWIGLNNGFLYTEYFKLLGGWDCRYETAPMGLADLAIRIQRDKSNMMLADIMLLDYDWFPGDTGDHKPIFDAQTEHDEPLYQSIYEDGLDKLSIEIANSFSWQNSPETWTRRII